MRAHRHRHRHTHTETHPHTHTHTHRRIHTHRDNKKVVDPLELELQVVMSHLMWVIRPKFWSS